jgi:hypothetical protein
MPDFGIDPVSIDVGHLVRRNVASLYSSLVTRPTGQAVRLAIENVLAEESGPFSLSIIDLSQVTIIDFSCADEVVAKLLLRYLADERPKDAFFIFRGLKELHRGPIEVVLERQALATVAELEDGPFQLMGMVSGEEGQVWQTLEELGVLAEGDMESLLSTLEAKEALNSLVQRRLVFRNPLTGDFRSLSSLMRDLA